MHLCISNYLYFIIITNHKILYFVTNIFKISTYGIKWADKVLSSLLNLFLTNEFLMKIISTLYLNLKKYDTAFEMSKLLGKIGLFLIVPCN